MDCKQEGAVGVGGGLDATQQDLGKAATVCESHSDTEAKVLNQGRWEEIHARRGEGQSVSCIAREMDLDRKTVRRCLRQSSWEPYSRRSVGQSLLAPHEEWLGQRVSEVNYSARIVFQELRARRGYTGSYETVKLAVRPLRQAATSEQLTQRRFETEPGEQAQVDWGQLSVMLGERRASVHVMVMTLGYSRRAYAEAFEHERMGDLLSAHENAFAHFGGRPENILYDRMRTVVLGTEGGKVRLNPTFEAFARHWGFTVRVCRAYRAKTKGKVESGVKYLKRNFAPGRVFRDLEDFNVQLMAWQSEVADVRVHGTTQERPIDRFAREAAALCVSAQQPSFLQALVRERVVAEDWMISIDANRYSVPFGLIGQTVQVLREGGQWVIRHRGQVVAEHALLPGRAQLSMRPEHGPGVVARNARKRYSTPGTPRHAVDLDREVEVRDLRLYEQLCVAPEQVPA